VGTMRARMSIGDCRWETTAGAIPVLKGKGSGGGVGSDFVRNASASAGVRVRR
jgi:hypothetical protein